MTLRNIINWILDTNIFILLGVILILLIIFFILWLIWDLYWNSNLYPEGDIRNSSNWDSFEYKKDRLFLMLKLIGGFALISVFLYLFFTKGGVFLS